MPRVLNPPPRPLDPALQARSWGRGAFLAALAATASLFAQPLRDPAFEISELRFEDAPFGPAHALALRPRATPRGRRLPLLIALHGYTESRHAATRGAWGWARDYQLGGAERALRRTPIPLEAFLGHVSDARYRRLRADLAARPYRGVVVVTPYTPNALDDRARATQFSRWITSTLLPRVRSSLPVQIEREATGIDGVSLGGLLALETGFENPSDFGVIGALQPAVRGRVERVLARRPQGAQRQRVRIVTSSRDYLRPDVLALHAAMRRRGISHELRDLQGPHDYPFNRGPGAIEMLLFHDRALRGEAAE